MRSGIAVVAGFVVLMVVVIGGTAAATELIVPGGLSGAASGRNPLPPNYFAANLVVSIMGAVLGGWVTARMAPSREMAHVLALAGLIILMSLPGLFGYGGSQDVQPVWYIWALPVLGVAGVLLGGWMRSRVVQPES